MCALSTLSTENAVSRRQSKDHDSVFANKHEILLVEDDEDQRIFLEAYLRKKGQAVVSAEDGAQGLTLYLSNQSQIQLVVTDYGMPNLTGGELIQAIRNQDGNLPIILTTGDADTPAVKRLSAQYAIELIAKPYSLSEIVKRIMEKLNT